MTTLPIGPRPGDRQPRRRQVPRRGRCHRPARARSPSRRSCRSRSRSPPTRSRCASSTARASKGAATQVLDDVRGRGLPGRRRGRRRRPQRLPRPGPLRAGQVPRGLHRRRSPSAPSNLVAGRVREEHARRRRARDRRDATTTSLKHRFDAASRDPTRRRRLRRTHAVDVDRDRDRRRRRRTTVPQPTVDTRFVPVDPKTGGPLVGCPDASDAAPTLVDASRRVPAPRCCTAFVIAVVSCTRRDRVARTPRRRARSSQVAEGRASTRRCCSRAATTCSSAPTRVRSSTTRSRRGALRQRAAADRSALRHDHGRPHRRRDGHGAARVVPARPVGRRSPGIGHAKINAAFNGGPQRVDRDDRAATSTSRSATTSRSTSPASARS